MAGPPARGTGTGAEPACDAALPSDTALGATREFAVERVHPQSAGGSPREVGGAATSWRGGDTSAMKLYFAGPLFSAAERDWNVALATALRAAGHEIFLPQEDEPGKDAAGIFATDIGGIDWADGLLAIMDGPEPDAGTCWEVGYAYGKKPILLVRTDIRWLCSSGDSGYNPMLTEAATLRLDLKAASMEQVIDEVLAALRRVEALA